MDDNRLAEGLVSAWLELSAVLRNDRFLHEISFNEAFVCSLLEKQRHAQPEQPYLAMGDISQRTRMLKSQVNKVVTDMERKGIVARRRSPDDLRVVYVEILPAGSALYQREHAHILNISERIIGDVGEQDITLTIEMLWNIIASIQQIIEGE